MKTSAAVLLLASCAVTPAFRDQPVVWRVGDTRDIAEPEERKFWPIEYFARALFIRQVERVFELHVSTPAGNTNALDEVPDSTWFTNRIGTHVMTPEQVATGPTAGEHDAPVLPLRVVKAKQGGGNPGFIAEDTKGRKYLVKFDPMANPEMQTANGVMVNRFLWALGYNVPADHITVFRRDQLVVPDALSVAVEAALGTSPRRPDGSYRAFASELLEGKPKGGWSAEGIRPDDPNDVVPHEDRRELRGLRVFAAWVSHTDMKEDNSLDMYVEEDGRKFLRHYLVDFGEALGGHAAEKGRREDGWEYVWDWGAQTRAFFSFGLWHRPWEDVRPTRWLAVGNFTGDGFDPIRWKEAYPYIPFSEMDAADAYWGAKLLMRFDRPTIAAVVAEGQFSDPEAAAHVVDALVARRAAIAQAYLDAVTPLDELRVEGDTLCMTDMAVGHGVASDGVVEGVEGVRGSWPIGADGRACLPLPPPDPYTVWRLRVRRSGGTRPIMQIHLRRGRVIGLVRVE
jgi:hypothetical protein